ncbi:hypothetical protein ACEWY4_005908 [Coilia grayii]|uniref:Uncharacterized protein n=1 Tax=Coilia grayii TaxID=363190 RepID=A0ABD1KK08_9TELE
MNLNLSDQKIHGGEGGQICLKEDKSDLLTSCCRRSVFEEPLPAYPNNSIISHLLRRPIHNKKIMNGNMFYLPTPPTLSGQEDHCIVGSKNITEYSDALEKYAPGGSNKEVERPISDRIEAKRARVENIIRGMGGSPNFRLQGGEDVSDTELELKEKKRKQKLPQHQECSSGNRMLASMAGDRGSISMSKNRECQRLRGQLQSMQRLLHQLEEKFFQVYNQNDSENCRVEEEDVDTVHDKQSHSLTQVQSSNEATSFPCDINVNDGGENRPDCSTSSQREKGTTEVSYLGSKGDEKNLQETLKYELSKAVNESIDLVFQNLSSTLLNKSSQLSSHHPCDPDAVGSVNRIHMSCDPLELSDTGDTTRPRPVQYCKSPTPPRSEQQTEALSLVVHKSPNSQLNSTSQTVKHPYALSQPPFQYGYATSLHDSQILEHLLKYGPHANFGRLTCIPPSMDRTSPDSVDVPWESISMRTKSMASHHGQHGRPGILGSVSVDGLCLPHVKMERRDLQSMAERSSFMCSTSLSIPADLLEGTSEVTFVCNENS